MVVLAGILSAGAAFVSTRRTIDEYDHVMITELERKGLAYAQTGRALLATVPGDVTFIVEELLPAALADSEALVREEPTTAPEEFQNPLLSFKAFAVDAEAPSGFREIAATALDGFEDVADSGDPALQQLVVTAAENADAAVIVDAERALIHGALPLSPQGEAPIIAVFTLRADDEFAFFAQVRAEAIRHGLLASVGIVLGVAAVGGGLSMFVSRDLTNRRLVEEQLREQARRDPLTGVLNHAAIIDELNTVLARGHDGSAAVIMADVDGMKATNDTYGHQVGDAALRAAAKAFDRDGAVVGRYGGDEFVVVLDGYDRAAGERYLRDTSERLAAITLTDAESGAAVPVSISMGLAVWPEEAATVIELVRLADHAMYASRLQRPLPPAGQSMPRRRDERALMMVGEIVPMLTSEGCLDDKLRLVAHRLAAIADYDSVSLQITEPNTGTTVGASYAPTTNEALAAWQRRQREPDGPSLRMARGRTRRPAIINDISTDRRMTKDDRAAATAAGMSALLVVPMLWRDDPLGMLSASSGQPSLFTAKDAQFLATVAREVAAIVRLTLLLDKQGLEEADPKAA